MEQNEQKEKADSPFVCSIRIGIDELTEPNVKNLDAEKPKLPGKREAELSWGKVAG